MPEFTIAELLIITVLVLTYFALEAWRAWRVKESHRVENPIKSGVCHRPQPKRQGGGV